MALLREAGAEDEELSEQRRLEVLTLLLPSPSIKAVELLAAMCEDPTRGPVVERLERQAAHFVGRLNELLAARGGLVVELAEGLGVSDKAAGLLLTGCILPQPETVKKAAAFFGVTIESLWPTG